MMTEKTDALLKKFLVFAVFAILGFGLSFAGYQGYLLYQYGVSISGVSDVNLSLTGTSSLKLTVTFNNNSSVDISVLNYNINVLLNGVQADSSSSTTPQYIAAGGNSSFVLNVNFDIKNFLSVIPDLITNYKAVMVSISGTVSINSNGITINDIPVSYSDNIGDLMS